MKKYECQKVGDYNCRLILQSEVDYKIGDIFVDEYKDENVHFVYGKYVIIAEY